MKQGHVRVTKRKWPTGLWYYVCLLISVIQDVYANPCSEHLQRCLQYVALSIQLFTTATDKTVICLPISQVVRIRMPFKQKLGVLSIFLLGFLVVIFSSTSYTHIFTC